ncbi:UNVERIFIED_CONTAM: Carboxylesterase 1 [Sesamum radiatum]|uniref:Carboxylesterase 1 n=1 Tax=Sesamum radiatum TaxID=300843 RepID=A0AAW2KCQ9_SESRA
MAAKNIVRPVFDNPFLKITVNPDGTLKREPEARNPANSDPNSTSSVLSRDVVLHPTKKTWLRLYIPNMATPPPSAVKLPLILYYHGGGFVFCNADSSIYDVFCKGLVEKLGAVVISLDYRLAPEHRLPAAYEDAVDGFYWIKNAEDEWITDYADLNNCFLAGTSAGANLAYHAGLRFAAMAGELEPLRVRGMILHHPYFSGTKRTGSEEKLANDPLLPLYAIDQMFDLSLPTGVDHDHEYSNPMANGGSKNLDEMRRLGWQVMVTGCFDDPLVDAGLECAKMLEGKGVETVRFFGDGYHAMEVFDPSMAGPLYDAITNFIFPYPT